MTAISNNNKPFIITNKGHGANIELKSFDNIEALNTYVKAHAKDTDIEIAETDLATIESVEDFLNREMAGSNVNGPFYIYSVYSDLDHYVTDMCTFSTAADAAFELKKLAAWGFDLTNFFNAEELAEYAAEENPGEFNIAVLYQFCGIARP